MRSLIIRLMILRWLSIPSLLLVRSLFLPDILEDIEQLDSNTISYHVPSGDEYIPGAMGMNVIGNGDYVNVVVQALSHVVPIRNFFLVPKNYAYSSNPLVHAFGILIRKLWSRWRFKCNVSPHEVLLSVLSSQ